MATREPFYRKVIDGIWTGRGRAATEAGGGPNDGVAEEPPFMPHEMLLTFTASTGRPTGEDERVQHLLRQATALVGGSVQVVTRPTPPTGLVGATQSGQGASAAELPVHPALTLRLFAPPPAVRMPGREHVKRAVDRINGQRATLQHRGVGIHSATPNWLLSATGSGGSAGNLGGPGTIPEPAPDGDWPFDVPKDGSWPVPETEEYTRIGSPQKPVIVAVLDTFPGTTSIESALRRYPDNVLLRRLSDREAITDVSRFSPPSDVPARRTNAEADHGLFVAGIIHSIAPHAKIHLLHVLDDQGRGRADVLLDALDYCLELAHSGHRVVVNMSLYLQIPPSDELWRMWFGALDRLRQSPAQMADLIDALDGPVEQRIAMLLDAGAIVVAAAGNDAFTYGEHPEPRLPAAYSHVTCVVAADRNGRLAAYSNHGMVPPTGTSIACFGGQGVLDGKTAVVPRGDDPRDGVVGVYSRHDLASPEGVLQNKAGWAYWSGTSFATPMVSAVAANLLARNELEREKDPGVARLTPRTLMRQILDLAEPAADPNLHSPYLRIQQRWQQPTTPAGDRDRA